MSKRQCNTEGCTNVLSQKARSEFCSACRAGYAYWQQQSPARTLQRRYQLIKLNNRLDEFLGAKGRKRNG